MCPMNHAHFTPINNVISQDKLQELYGEQERANVPGSSGNSFHCSTLISQSQIPPSSQPPRSVKSSSNHSPFT